MFKIKLFLLAFLIFTSLAFFVTTQENSGAQNIFLDSDQDGLTDEEEKMYGTDPKNRDTDNDSYSDGAEIKAGYNPKIPAPGDRLIDFQNKSSDETGVLPTSGNLTNQISQKIADLPSDTEVSVDDIQAIIDESLSTQDIEEEMPQFSESDIKIKKQDYDKLGKEAAEKKKKDDFEEYIIAIYYIMSSNSPEPITSGSDISTIIAKLSLTIINALSSQNTDTLSDISQSGKKMLEQMKDLSVPEDLIELHIKAMRYAYYAQTLKNLVNSNSSDPLKDIADFSKIQAYAESLMNFSQEAQEKFTEYGLSFDDSVKEKLKEYGIEENLIEKFIE